MRKHTTPWRKAGCEDLHWQEAYRQALPKLKVLFQACIPSLERPCRIPLTPKRAVGAPLRVGLLTQQREHALWELIRLCHHRGTSLLQDLGT